MPEKPCARCGREVRGNIGIEQSPGVYICSTCLKPGEVEGMGPLELNDDSVFDVPTKPCPACSAKVPLMALRCGECGWDLSGTIEKPKPGPKRCPHCGFDRAGYDGRRCPKCKKMVERPSILESNAEYSREQTIASYRTPVLVIFAAVIASAVVFGLLDAVNLFMVTGLAYLVTAPVGFLGLVVAGRMWLPIDEPPGLVLLKTFEVYAVHLAISAVLLALPIPGLNVLLMAIAFAWCFYYFFDLEWPDAMLTALVVGGVTFIAFWILGRVLASVLG